MKCLLTKRIFVLLAVFLLLLTCSLMAETINNADADADVDVEMDPLEAQLEAVSEKPDTFFNEGMNLYYQKRFEDSAEMFLEALEKDPLNTMALSFYLAASYRSNNLMQAVNLIEQKAIDGGSTPVLKAQLGIAYFSRGKFDQSMMEEAMNQLREALRENPDLSIANTGMGMIYFERRLMPRAKGFLIRAIRSNPSDIMALELLGNILMVNEKKPDAALEFFQRIIKMYPGYSDSWFLAGSAYQRMNNNSEAIKYFRLCMDADPLGLLKGYDAPLRIGDIYLQQQDWDNALEYYRQALVINPDNPYAKTQMEKAKKRGREWEGKKVNPLLDKIEN